MTPQVTVIIVNWNGLGFLRPCLLSLEDQEFRDFKVVIVDNGSSDGSVEFIREEFGWVKLITNDHNVGFAAANNQAIRISNSPYIATLNNDTRPESDWLKALVETIETNPGIGACASKMLFADRPNIINSAGIAIDRAGISWDRFGGQTDNPEETDPQEIFGACAGAALYRRALFQDVGLFDEDFFAYLEDVDLAWRAQAAGWRTVYVPTARVVHHHSGTSVEGSPFKSQLLGRNKIWLLAKNYPWPQFLWYGPIALLYDLGTVSLALLKGNKHSLIGRLEALKHLSVALKKRHNRKTVIFQLMEPLSPPWIIWQRYQHLDTGKT